MIKGRVTKKDLDWVKEQTGDDKFTKERLKSGRWFLPSRLTVDIYKHFKNKSRTKR